MKKSQMEPNSVVGECPICGAPIMKYRAYGMFCGNADHRVIFDEICLEADNEPEEIQRLCRVARMELEGKA